MENVNIFMAGSKIPCTVCNGECVNRGWHLTNAKFCSIECMIGYIETINTILDNFEEKIKTIEKKIEAQEKFIKKTEEEKKKTKKFNRKRNHQ